MLTIAVRLLHGTIRAGSPDDTVMAGGDPRGEWPPSPARLFAALVAADGTGARCAVTDGSELEALERLGAPRIYASDLADLGEMPLKARFVVQDVTAEGTVQDYPARRPQEVRPGVKASPRAPVVVYQWDAELSREHVVALARRSARVGYLGCADSPVQVTIVEELSAVEGLSEWRPGAARGVTLPVPFEGFLGALDAAFEEWSSGRPMRRSWIRTRRERYAPTTAGVVTEPHLGSGRTIWLELDRRVAPQRVLQVTETLRAAVLEHLDAVLGSGPAGSRVPWQLHGHDVPDEVGRPYQIARFLALPNVGHRYSDGMIHGAAIWLPPTVAREVEEAVREVVTRRLRRLRGSGIDVGVRVRLPDSPKWSTNPRRWSDPARRWFSATPAVAERGRRRGPTADDVRGWFTNAGYPEPTLIRVSPVPTRSGVARLGGRAVHREGRDRYPYYWIDVAFEESVEGPICVGRSRSFGLGLLAPEPDQSLRESEAEAAGA